MSGKLQPPLLTPTQAESLLDQVVYEQVFECIDLDALSRFEHSLGLMVSEVQGVSANHVDEVAAAMIDRALRRMPGDVRNYLQATRWITQDCELCDEEACPAGPTSTSAPRARIKG